MREVPQPVRTPAPLGVLLVLAVLASGCGGGCQQERPAAEKSAAGQPQAAAKSTGAAPRAAAGDAGGKAQNVEWIEEFDDVEDELGLWVEGEPDYGPAPLTVKFSVEAMGVKEIPGAKYYWDFGDGTRSNEASPVHVYEKPGEYEVRLVIKDAYGKTGWDEIDIDVESPGEAG